MNTPLSHSKKAQQATALVVILQSKLTDVLSDISQGEVFEKVEWLRDEGKHGGGVRFVAPAGGFFNRASVNVSHVHYDDLPEKSLASASALSAIVHPENPHLPSIHIHFSWTEKRNGNGYWRMMADLNPSRPDQENKKLFEDCLKANAADFYDEGREQGDEYFYIPALQRHRGVSHFYLEGFDSGNYEDDLEMAEHLAAEVIDCYQKILKTSLKRYPTYGTDDKQQQIDYHTLYLYQVLTLDKGTTAGILVHNQNDLGVFGSLPAKINGGLLKSWIDKTPAPLNELVANLHKVFNSNDNVAVGDEQKIAFAKILREFYGHHRNLLTFQN